MKTKILLSFLLLLAIVVAGGFYFYQTKTSQFVIQDKQIADNTTPFVIKISYPYINGLDDFNRKVKTIIDKEISDFKTNSLENDKAVKDTDPTDYAKYPRTYELDISYDKGQVDGNIVSAMFNVYNFEGGAHGASYFVPLNYNVKTKTEIKLVDLFAGQSDYLQKISEFCIKDLTKQITDKLGDTSGTWIKDGAGPKEENFQFFLIGPPCKDSQLCRSMIIFYFPQYQVAFGAAGDFKVTMPR